MGQDLEQAGPDEPGLAVDLLAAQLRADAGDTETFFAVLVAKLRDALGERVRVQQAGRGLRRRPAAVTGVEVDLTDAGEGLVLRAERVASGVQCSVARPVRGIVLSNRPLPMAEWLDLLVKGLAEQAGRSQQTRDALGGLLT